MKTLVIIDGQNYVFKGAKGTQMICDNQRTEIIYHFFRNLIKDIKSFEKTFQNIDYVICWDGGYKRKLTLSLEAYDKGIISKSYKQDRRDKRAYQSEQEKLDTQDMFRQIDLIKVILNDTKISQVYIPEVEADDLVCSLKAKYKNEYDVLILLSTDKDYYQLIDEKTMIYKKNEFFGLNEYKDQYKLDNGDQWIDVGALSGDAGDTIQGVDGIGEKTALDLILKHKSLKNLKENLITEMTPYFLKYGDVKNMRELYDEGKIKLPFKKSVLNIIEQFEKVEVAYILKRMDDNYPVEIVKNQSSENKIRNHFTKFKFFTLFKDMNVLDDDTLNMSADTFNNIKRIMKGSNTSNTIVLDKDGKEIMTQTKGDGNTWIVRQPTLF